MLETKIIKDRKIIKVDIMGLVTENAKSILDKIEIKTIDDDQYNKYVSEGRMTNCIKCKVENVLEYFENPSLEIQKFSDSFMTLEQMMITTNDY